VPVVGPLLQAADGEFATPSCVIATALMPDYTGKDISKEYDE
jgi:hypothetical protein